MGLFNRKSELRAAGELEVSADLLTALLDQDNVTRRTALQVPTLAGGVDLIAGLIAGTPIKLYEEADGATTEIKDDPRVRLLNDDPGDTLNANDMWRALVNDYYFAGGGYLYIKKARGKYQSLHYVKAEAVGVQWHSTGAILKDFDYTVDGQTYRPFDFFRILRNTRDGAKGVPIGAENSVLLGTIYQSLLFEKALVKKGGNKRGFLKASRKLDEKAMDKLKEAFRRLYSNTDEADAVVVLNDGIDFKESSATSTEMQLTEQKKANADEVSKLLHVSSAVMSGDASADKIAGIARTVAIPLMVTIQCALNRSLLLEKEKGRYYFAFDTRELLKGDMQTRFAAYKTALDANFMQIDEVRYAEDLDKLGLDWIKLGLNDVLFDPKTKTVYTPNTNQVQKLGPGGG